MRYCLTFLQDLGLVKIGVNCHVVPKRARYFKFEDACRLKHKYRFVYDLFMVDGVEEVILTRYEVWVARIDAFEWIEMLPAILNILKMRFSPLDDIEENRPSMVEKIIDGTVCLFPIAIEPDDLS